MSSQITDTLFMIRPISFRKNEQTAGNNYFQQDMDGASSDQIQGSALSEFDGFVEKLRDKGVQVIVFEDLESDKTPDSIFPNNWISFHDGGDIITYPMYAENRRRERRTDVIDTLRKAFEVTAVDTLAHWEDEDKFLEGTGSMILDRGNKVVYASISARTNEEVLSAFCKKKGYKPVVFTSYQTAGEQRLPIYHTNVMMALGEDFAVLCADSIDDVDERKVVIRSLEQTNKEVITITEYQMHHFAGNMLQVKNKKGERFTVMSDAAYRSLTEDQIQSIEKYGGIIHSPIPTIELLGGGSVRCMMAEVFLPIKSN